MCEDKAQGESWDSASLDFVLVARLISIALD